jgi:hypothetical protein
MTVFATRGSTSEVIGDMLAATQQLSADVSIEFAVRAPTLALPRKRERELTDVDARQSTAHCRVVSHGLPTRQALPPLPLTGEGWGTSGYRQMFIPIDAGFTSVTGV